MPVLSGQKVGVAGGVHRAGTPASGQSGPDPSAGSARPEWTRGKEFQLSKKLYVGNLAFSTTEDELRTVFEEHGTVGSVNVITDRETGRSRGFGFVEMDDASAADAAMRALDGVDLGGRNLRVNEAQDKRGGGGGGGGGGRRY